jgi:hypothetical protein
VNRFALMVPRRIEHLRALEAGAPALRRATEALAQSRSAREGLVYERNVAVGLIGASAAVATAAAAAAAASASAAALANTTAAFEATGVGMAESSAGLVKYGSSLATLAKGQGAAARLWGHVTLNNAAAGIAAVVNAVNGALNDFDAAYATEERTFQELDREVRRRRDLIRELDADIGNVLAVMRACPDIDQESIEDPRTPLPSLPGDGIQG